MTRLHFCPHCRMWGVDYRSRQGYNGFVVMAPCERWLCVCRGARVRREFSWQASVSPHGWCFMRRKFHIPPDYVVDRCAADGESGSHRDFLFRPHVWPRGRRQISERITSVISMAWHFTTKSGGICKNLHGSLLLCSSLGLDQGIGHLASMNPQKHERRTHHKG